MHDDRESENMRNRFERHRIQKSMADGLCILFCDNVAASFRELSEFFLESRFSELVSAGHEKTGSLRRFSFCGQEFGCIFDACLTNDYVHAGAISRIARPTPIESAMAEPPAGRISEGHWRNVR